MKAFKRAILACAMGMLMVSPALAHDGRPVPRPQGGDGAYTAPPGLVVEMGVAREGRHATYSVTLRNYSATAVRDIFLAGTIAEGATFVEPGRNPARSWFRGVEGGAAVWLAEEVPARGATGPFTYRVSLSGDAAPAVHAWTHRRQPADGTAASDPVRVLPSLTSATLASHRVNLTGEQLSRKLRVAHVTWTGNLTGVEHEHGGVINYVLEGVHTLDQGGIRASYGPGAAFLHGGPGRLQHIHSNLGDTAVRSLNFSAQPAAEPPRPNTLFESDEVTLKEGPNVISLSLVEGQPGSSIPTHWHPGPGVSYVLEGTVDFQLESGTTRYGPGDIFVEPVGVLHSALVGGNTVARVLVLRASPLGEPASVFPVLPPHPWTIR